MKKTLALFLVILSLAALVGCSGPAGDPAPPATSSSAETSESKTDNPLLLSDFAVSDVISGGGSVIGTRGSVHLEKASLPEFSSADFSTYFTEFVENRVDGSGHNWVSIIFDDGTGFCFISSGTWASYGELDDVGRVSVPLGECGEGEEYRFIDYEIRTIPDPTIQQMALAPDNYFEPVKDVIFSTTASENGLGDTAFYVSGEVLSRFDVSGYDTIQVSAEYGDLYISDVLAPIDGVSVGDSIDGFFVYTGWSEDLDGACGAYVYHE